VGNRGESGGAWIGFSRPRTQAYLYLGDSLKPPRGREYGAEPFGAGRTVESKASVPGRRSGVRQQFRQLSASGRNPASAGANSRVVGRVSSLSRRSQVWPTSAASCRRAWSSGRVLSRAGLDITPPAARTADSPAGHAEPHMGGTLSPVEIAQRLAAQQLQQHPLSPDLDDGPAETDHSGSRPTSATTSRDSSTMTRLGWRASPNV
jgi:hypothetical protein